jgi:asparagine synthase (glutamine-hydrolysing)
MCGIVGFVEFNKNSSQETSQQILARMTGSLKHRGPDDHGTYVDQDDFGTLAFGHTRLSIIDLSPLGHQPMFVGRYVITFNGEMYNYAEVRSELEKFGITFKSHSDTEVIVRAFEKWGVPSLQKFRGMFAMAIYDKEKQELTLMRDRVGVKPLFYYFHKGVLLFSSELKSFHEHPSFTKELDMGSLGLFLQYNYIPGPHSIFKNVKKLSPGHVLKISLKDQSFKEEQYWSVIDCYNKPVLDISDEEAMEQTEKILSEAFNYRMVADVPVGVFLSGGFDSSAVAALLQKGRTEKLKTFTIGFGVTGFDEAPDARKVAQHLGTNHTEYYCEPADALAIIPQLPEIYDEPFSDNSTVPSVLVSQLARKSVTVALSGDGGDEIFAGYDKFNRSLSYVKGWAPARRMVSGVMKLINPEKIPVLKNQYNAATRYEKMKMILASKNSREVLKIISQHIPHTETRRLLKKPFTDYRTAFDVEGPFRNDNPLSPLLAIDYLTFLTDNNLSKMDRASMSVALEAREPFLDQHVIEYVAQLPSHMKIRNGVNKYLLKEIVYRHIPREIMDRPKKPFLAPLSVWFMEQLKQFFLQYLDRDRLVREGYFNPDPIIHMRDQFLAGRPVKHQKLWNILIFEMWHERWMK